MCVVGKMSLLLLLALFIEILFVFLLTLIYTVLRKPNSITSDECFRRKHIAVSIAKILCHTFANDFNPYFNF